MSGYVRRTTSVPTLDFILAIEGVVIVDLAPPDPALGAGTGAVLLVGEFEDGEFATDADVKGGVEVFGSNDMRQKFGGFGYTYDGVVASNPSARRHAQELWNGNGWLKAFKLRAQRLFVSRVDTSVGEVTFEPLASIDGGVGPYVIPNATQFGFTTNTGGPAQSTAITGVPATVTGAAAAFASILSGDSFGLTVDGGPTTTVVFSGGDTTIAAVIARINSTLGYVAASNAAGQLKLDAIRRGTSGSLELTETTAGVLVKLGLVAGSTAGTGNVTNRDAVTAAEVASIINGTAGLAAINVKARVTADGRIRVYNSVSAVLSSITAGAGASILLLPTATALATDHLGGNIPAGTRVRDVSANEWVTMQTLVIPAGDVGPFPAVVRPALDDGMAAGAAASAVNVLVDQSFTEMVVRNPAALTAAKDEIELDNAYLAALAATLDESGVCRDANYLLVARRTDTVVREGRANAIRATECGMAGRKYVTGSALGRTVSQILADVAQFRSDRVFYTGKGLRVRIPEIATRGVAGGLGFTRDGVITVRPDGPLTTLCALLAPEENPGQQTNLIDDFFQVDSFGEVLDVEAYEAFKRAGVAAPRIDRDSGTVFQSGVTSSLEPGRITMARRKMADYIQDNAAVIFKPYVKKLNTQARRDKVRGVWEQWLSNLQSPRNPQLSRIEGFAVDDSANAGNTPGNLARGIYFVNTKVRTLSSMDDIVVQTEIGESAIVSNS